jgi:hypothetical protein
MEIHLFEDDYGQIELLPATNRESCRHEMAKRAAAVQPGDMQKGFKLENVRIRANPPKSLHSMGIALDSLRVALPADFCEVRALHYQFESQAVEVPNTCAFAVAPTLVLFAEWDSENIAMQLWLTLDIAETTLAERALACLSAIARGHDLLLADWGWNFCAGLDETERLERYLFARVERFRMHRSTS